MNKTLSVALAVVAGLAGGLLTRYIAPPTAFAQDQASPAKEIRAQSFTLVDQSDRPVGTFAAEPAGPSSGQWVPAPKQIVPGRSMRMRIVLRDANGREIWSAGDIVIRQLSQR